MLWARFADPLGVLKTYSLTGAIDFLLYLLEKQQDDLLWETWLYRKPTKGEGKNTKYLTYPEYKKSAKMPQLRDKKAETVTADQEQQRLEFASQFIKIHKGD